MLLQENLDVWLYQKFEIENGSNVFHFVLSSLGKASLHIQHCCLEEIKAEI